MYCGERTLVPVFYGTLIPHSRDERILKHDIEQTTGTSHGILQTLLVTK